MCTLVRFDRNTTCSTEEANQRQPKYRTTYLDLEVTPPAGRFVMLHTLCKENFVPTKGTSVGIRNCDCDASILYRKDASLSTGELLLTAQRSDYGGAVVLQLERRLLGNESGRVCITLDIEGRWTFVKEPRRGLKSDLTGRMLSTNNTEDGGKDGEGLEEHVDEQSVQR